MQKREFYGEWIKNAFSGKLRLAEAVSFLLTILGWGVTQLYPMLGDVMSFLIVAIPAAVLLGTIILGFLLAPYLIYAETESKRSAFEEQLTALEETSPEMRFHDWRNHQAPIRNQRTGQVSGEPFFTQVQFVNDPEVSTQAAEAERVVGHIEVYDRNRSTKLFRMVGRWADTDEFAQVGPAVIELNQINIAPNAVPRTLDVVLKYEEDDDCHGYNNETPREAPRDWRDHRRRLEKGDYAVRVRLRGRNVDEEFWFSLHNPGSGGQVELGLADT